MSKKDVVMLICGGVVGIDDVLEMRFGARSCDFFQYRLAGALISDRRAIGSS
jgi:hypothetical protein